jgi:hypothetical protein
MRCSQPLAVVLPRFTYENTSIASHARSRQRWLILFSLDANAMTVRAILYGLGAIATASLFIQPFRQKYRHASRWVRTAFVVLASVATAWSALGSFLISQEPHLSRSSFWSLDHIESALGGMLLGMAIFFLIHPEYRKLHYSSPPSP